jgi:ankyrin repeat protein
MSRFYSMSRLNNSYNHHTNIIKVATHDNDIKKIKKILWEIKLIASFEYKQHILNSCLKNACVEGNLQIIKLFIDEGANNFVDGMIGACFGGHMDVFELMIDLERIYNRSTFNQNTWDLGLKYACQGGNIDIIKLLLSKGATISDFCLRASIFNVRPSYDIIKLLVGNNTYRINIAFRYALSNEKYHIAFYLLNKGAVYDYRNEKFNDYIREMISDTTSIFHKALKKAGGPYGADKDLSQQLNKYILAKDLQ